jgi:hypothetical protein
MKRADVSTTVSDADVPPNLRPFIDVLLKGDREGYSNTKPAICSKDVDEHESRTSRMAGTTGLEPAASAVTGRVVEYFQ